MKTKIYLEKITEFNKIDWMIIFIVFGYTIDNKKISIGELTRKIGIAPVNMWKHLNKLKEIGIIIVPEAKKGKKKFLTFNQDSTMDNEALKYFNKFLKSINLNPTKEELKLLKRNETKKTP